MRYPLIIRSTIHLDHDIEMRMPVIFTKDGILKSYLEYALMNRNKSHSWLDASASAIRLLVEFVEFNAARYKYPADLFKSFSEMLFSGTINAKGIDEYGLRWSQKSIANGNKIISYVTQYSDWLCNVKEMDCKANLNPWRKATSYEQRLNWAAYSHRHSKAFLAHTWSREGAVEQNMQSRNVRFKQDDRRTDGDQAENRFPDTRIDDLLHKGFVRPGVPLTAPVFKRLELRDILITILMHFGGLRRSEPFHLWFNDIIPDPENSESALVTVYHPEIGASPERDETRKETLARKYQMKPRNKYERSKALHAGWKNNKLSAMKGNFMVVHWFAPEAGEYFLFYWKLYLKAQYKAPNKLREHPFAFTNQYGHPYTLKQYVKKHSKAVERIGLSVSKELGTTEHGHRYAYLNRLEEAGVDDISIASCMHHKSLTSQQSYESQSANQVRKILINAEKHAKSTLTIEKE
jgi:hypothetical protein